MKEVLEMSVFAAETSDLETYSVLIILEASLYDNDKLKKNFLLNKLIRNGKEV